MSSIVLPGRGASHFLQQLYSREILLRLAVCLIAATAMLLITRAWTPPFPYRTGYLPERDMTARVPFRVTDRERIERTYEPGDLLAPARRPLDTDEIQVLLAEHDAAVRDGGLLRRIQYAAASLAMFLALCALMGVYLHFHQPQLLVDVGQLSLLLAAAVGTVAVCMVAAQDAWRAETIPLILFGMTAALLYGRQLACALTVTLALTVTVGLGMGLAEFSILCVSAAAPTLMLGRVRSRTRLIVVGFLGGGISLATVLCAGTLEGQTFGLARATHISAADAAIAISERFFAVGLLAGGAWYGLCVVLAGCLMTGALPYLERWLGIQTDLSLMDLGDPAHPLLLELARRAPGTYNHSINVASIAQGAAEAIGANGLLTRVGAYFHDIGKMLKPDYFIENISGTGNQHDSLVPTMSTLVIIAHVKDGVDLGRKHRLPESIIDFIEQHHGTTLVEYFYRRAEQQQTPDSGAVDESRFRYPGPKPQTREAAVLMLADAAESAARSLVDPTPARLESLVQELARKRLLDGQFDECGLTLQEVHRVEDSLVKSLNAVYHGRVKYPGQQTA